MYGRDGELAKLNRERQDVLLPMQRRRAADRAYRKIANQLRDKKLMGMRMRLVGAARAGDAREQHKIQMQMRDYLGEDKETGLQFE